MADWGTILLPNWFGSGSNVCQYKGVIVQLMKLLMLKECKIRECYLSWGLNGPYGAHCSPVWAHMNCSGGTVGPLRVHQNLDLGRASKTGRVRLDPPFKYKRCNYSDKQK